MTACIIMHNMIVEDEGDGAANVDFIGPTGPPEPCNNTGEGRNEWLNNHIRSELPNDPEQDITCQATYLSLQHNLVEHLWARRGAMGWCFVSELSATPMLCSLNYELHDVYQV